jgi:hypothetical protein
VGTSINENKVLKIEGALLQEEVQHLCKGLEYFMMKIRQELLNNTMTTLQVMCSAFGRVNHAMKQYKDEYKRII